MRCYKVIFLLLLLFIFLMPVLAISSFIPIQSWVFDSSFGIFSDEIDWGFNLSSNIYNGSFYLIDKKLLISGFYNYFNQTINSVFSSPPFYFGFYLPLENPMSFCIYYSSYTNSTNPDGSTDYTSTQALKTVTSGSKTTDYYYVSDETTENYDFPDKKQNQLIIQYLIGLKNLAIGIDLIINTDNDTTETISSNTTNIPAGVNFWKGNKTEIRTVYYDTAPAGEAPSMATDYVETIVASMPNPVLSLETKIPFFIKLSNIQLYTALNYTLSNTNYDASYKSSITNPQSTYLTNLHDFSMKRNKATHTIGIDSILSLPDFFKLNDKNKFNIGLSASVDLHFMATTSYTEITKTYNFPGSGADGVLTSNQKIEKTFTYANNPDFSISTFFQYYFYFFPFKNFKFGISPKLEIDIQKYYTDPLALLSETIITYNDNDNNGDYTSTGDTSNRTTTVYYGTDISNDFNISIGFNIPASISFRPFNSFVEFVIGNNIKILYNIDNSTTASNTGSYVSENINYDNSGNITSETYNSYSSPTSVTDVSITWEFLNAFSYIFVFHITDNIKFNFKINGTDFWDITDYMVQFIWTF